MIALENAVGLDLALNGGTPALQEALDRGKGAAYIDDAEIEAVTRVLRSRVLSRYAGGKSLVAAFEQKLQAWTGRRYTLGCATGTAAMRLALIALGVRPGDEVLVPALLPSATADAVIAQGAVPVFVDVNDSFTMDPDDAERKITLDTRAIIGVHAFGMACDMDRLTELVHQNKLLIIEDTAGSLGATFDGKRLGGQGFASTFSFEPYSVITAGEGGAVAFGDPVPHERATRYHDHGGAGSALQGPRQMIGTKPAFWGENLRMGELQGAVLSAQIDKLSTILEGMVRVRRALCAELRELGVTTHGDASRGESASSVFVKTKNRKARDLCLKALLAEGIPAHLMCEGKVAYDSEHVLKGRVACTLGPGDRPPPRYERGMCPVAEELVSVSVGVYAGPKYTASHVHAIAQGIRRVLHYVELQG